MRTDVDACDCPHCCVLSRRQEMYVHLCVEQKARDLCVSVEQKARDLCVEQKAIDLCVSVYNMCVEQKAIDLCVSVC